MPIDHISIYPTPEKFEDTVAWYLKALNPLKYTEILRFPGAVGLGTNGKPDFWVIAKENAAKQDNHFAFRADDKETVNRFHAAGVEAGGKCNGPPGPRPQYAPEYYGAFVFDPIGNNVEAVGFFPVEK
ncbi:hypothetical protein K432DRAFT_287471 [Lepidopterella palustris CBS 459.81]|uniref:VOC domain-containing protein n=1 Tax=Lepidopterella palustris CBS 459.81 TaxID=1314670 RepID=A0A8E2EJE7_9PEZI|nr:hypothetical protein K432DRAFT_287471 [Lepidopterella palustris CBS 459.81]